MDPKVNIAVKTLRLTEMPYLGRVLENLAKALANNLSLKYFLETVKYSWSDSPSVSLKDFEEVFRTYGIKAKIVNF